MITRIINQRVLSSIASFFIILNSFTWIFTTVPVYAQDEQEITNQTENISVEPTAVPQSEPAPSLLPQFLSPSPSVMPLPTPASDWQPLPEGGNTTLENVRIDHTYSVPQNSKVAARFNKLPDNPGKLTVKEIKLTPEQIKETGALSDIAYDINSDMVNGTFEYTLTLPASQNQSVEVKYSEDGKSFSKISGEKVEHDVVTISGLTHFTIFVVAGTVSNNMAIPFDETNANVLINEFLVDPSSGNEWIEFFNQTDQEIDMVGWQICELTGSGSENCYALSFVKLLPNGFAVHELTNKLNNPTSNGSGDRITLKNSNGVTTDQVTYQKNSSQIVNAQDLGQNTIRDDESIGRSEDGGNLWQVFSETTKGYNNSGDLTFITVGQNFPYVGIQNALNDIAEGRTVYVTEGEYTETVYIEKSVTLIGADRDNTTIFDYDCSEDPTISINADNVTVKNLIINNDGCEGSVVWIGDGSTGVIIQDNKLIDGYYGIELRNGSSQIQILDNVISDNEDNGIYSGGEGALSGITISDNSIENNQDTGVYLGQLTGIITISGNTVSNNSYFGVYLGTIVDAAVTIQDNDVSNNAGIGIYVNNVTDSTLTVAQNTIADNIAQGIYLSQVSGSEVTIGEDNTISDNNNAGIYLDSSVTGVEITGNIIQNNGTESMTTGIVVNNAEGNKAHNNIIFGNNVGVANFDESIAFDARENWWGVSTGPQVDTNPDGTGDGIEGVVSYRPFYKDEALEDLSTLNIDPADLANLLNTGVFSLLEGESSDSVTIVTVEEELTLTVDNNDNQSSVFLPVGTTIQRSDGLPLDVSDLTANDVDESSLSGMDTGLVIDGALQWGIPNLGLQFSQPITLRIFVGTSLNGQTLQIKRSVSGVGDWTSDGIVTPATCVVSAGICTFQATKASYYATTRTTAITSSDSSTTSSNSSGGGSSGGGSSGGTSGLSAASAPSCNAVKPGSTPTLTSAIAKTNSVILTWASATDPVTYYLVTYGETPGAQTYGNPNIGNATSYTVSGLSGGQTYYFKVRAGNGCAPGDYSNEISATPGGGFIVSPAAGFIPGILSAETQVIQDKQGEVESIETEAMPTPQAQTTTITTTSENVGILAFFSNLIRVVTTFFARFLGDK